MNQKTLAKEKRKQDHLEKLGTQHPACNLCGESDHRCLEAHHIAGRQWAPEMAIVCRNCHRKLSDEQRDHPQPLGSDPSVLETIGHFLLGLADQLALAADKLREFGAYLLDLVRQVLPSVEGCHE